MCGCCFDKTFYVLLNIKSEFVEMINLYNPVLCIKKVQSITSITLAPVPGTVSLFFFFEKEK